MPQCVGAYSTSFHRIVVLYSPFSSLLLPQAKDLEGGTPLRVRISLADLQMGADDDRVCDIPPVQLSSLNPLPLLSSLMSSFSSFFSSSALRASASTKAATQAQAQHDRLSFTTSRTQVEREEDDIALGIHQPGREAKLTQAHPQYPLFSSHPSRQYGIPLLSWRRISAFMPSVTLFATLVYCVTTVCGFAGRLVLRWIKRRKAKAGVPSSGNASMHPQRPRLESQRRSARTKSE